MRRNRGGWLKRRIALVAGGLAAFLFSVPWIICSGAGTTKKQPTPANRGQYGPTRRVAVLRENRYLGRGGSAGDAPDARQSHVRRFDSDPSLANTTRRSPVVQIMYRAGGSLFCVGARDVPALEGGYALIR
jgi:hypothetical protein